MPATATAAPKHAAAAPRSATLSHAPAKAAPVAKQDVASAPAHAPAPTLPAFAKPAVAALHPAAAPRAAAKVVPMPPHVPAQASAVAKTPPVLPAPLKPAEKVHDAHQHSAPIPIAHKTAVPAHPAHTATHAAAPKPKPKLAPLGPPKTPSLGSGQPLAPHIQEAIQNSLMVDLSSVRLHASTAAERKAQSLSARAFTFGNDIFLGHGEHPTDLTLISHEAAHVIQQQHTAPVVQAWSSDRSDRYEREADQAAAAVASGQSFAVRERVDSPRVQRFGISDALDWLADKAYIIPGFRMFTIVLGVNPINMEHVERSAANVLRAIVEFLPGGTLITDALEKYGVFDKVGNWLSGKIDELGMVGSSIKQALMDFLDSLSWRDIFHLGDVWDRAKRIFTDPIDKIINFVKGTIEDIWKFVRDAILKPISKLAEGTSGWPLLIAVMGKNPITGEPVPRTPETLIGGFMHLIHEDEIWANIKKANAVARAFAWFQSVLSGLLGFVSQIPGLFIKALKSLQWSDILDLPAGFMKIVGVFGTFAKNFFSWALGKVWDLLKIIFEVVAPKVMPYLLKVGAAFKKILKDPLGFVRHLIDAALLGLNNFLKNFGEHLKKALLDWLVGALPGIYIPKAFTLPEFGKFVLSILGITWAQIRAKIVKALGPNGETIMKGLETAFDIVVALIKGGPAAAWELIKEKLTNLKDMVVDGIVGLVTDTIIKKAIPKLVAMFIPGAGFISAIISIYSAIMTFVEKLSKIVAAVKAFVDSIVAIANGQIAGAAAKVESGLETMLSLTISFLASFFGLGGVANKVMEFIKKLQGMVDKGLDVAINWVVTKAKSLFAKLFGKKDDKGDKDDPASAALKKKVGAALAGKSVKDEAEEKALLDSVYSEFKPQGVKSIRFEPSKQDPGVIDVLVSASSAEKVAKLDMAKPGALQELAKIGGLMNPFAGRTTIQVYYGVDRKQFGRPISQKAGQAGHAEVYLKKSFPDLLERLRKERKRLLIPATVKVPILLEINRTPCDGCATSHLLELINDAKSNYADVPIEITISSGSVSQGAQITSFQGLQALIAQGVVLTSSTVWAEIKKQMISNGIKQFDYRTRTYDIDDVNELIGHADDVQALIDKAIEKLKKAKPEPLMKGS